jgi:hypothetical protein
MYMISAIVYTGASTMVGASVVFRFSPALVIAILASVYLTSRPTIRHERRRVPGDSDWSKLDTWSGETGGIG